MRRRRTIIEVLLAVLALAFGLASFAPHAAFAEDEEVEVDDGEAGSLRRSDRMEFDARLVRGQKATSGAVYLFQRAPRALPPLVVLEQSYLDRIVEPVLGTEKREAKEGN